MTTELTQTAAQTVPFAVPLLTDEAVTAVVEVLRSGWLTTGPQTAAFERDLADYLGAAHVVATASCTTALEMCLRALDLPRGAPVLTPSLTFCGAVNAIVHAGLRPVFVDIDEETLVPSPETVAAAADRARREHGGPAAMVVCHMAGYPVDVHPIAAAAGLPAEHVVEDVAHGPGGSLDGTHIGSSSFAACFSFYATKNLPIGEGGAVATYDKELADRVRALRLHGMSKDSWRRYLPGGSWRYDVQQLGLKANMTDPQAAVGRAQLRAFPEWQRRRAELVARYDAALCGLPGLTLPQRGLRNGERHSWHIYQIRVPARDDVFASLEVAGVSTSVHFIPVHQFSAYQDLLGREECATVPVTDRVAAELLSLPLYPAMTESLQDRVIEVLTETLTDRS